MTNDNMGVRALIKVSENLTGKGKMNIGKDQRRCREIESKAGLYGMKELGIT